MSDGTKSKRRKKKTRRNNVPVAGQQGFQTIYPDRPKVVKRPKPVLTMATSFVPKFWLDVDQRRTEVKEIVKRYKTLQADCGSETIMADMLCQRAVFLATQIETLEVKMLEGDSINLEAYGRLVGTLKSLLMALGLKRRQVTTVDSLSHYVEGKAKS